MSEAEESISELEDKMVGITYEEQKKVKRMKRTEDILRDLWTISNVAIFDLHGSQRKNRKRNGMRKFLNRL